MSSSSFSSIDKQLRQALAQLHEMQLPPLEHERALMGLLDVFTRERAGYLLAALNERWDALQSKLSQKQSSEATESAATLSFTSMEQVRHALTFDFVGSSKVT